MSTKDLNPLDKSFNTFDETLGKGLYRIKRSVGSNFDPVDKIHAPTQSITEAQDETEILNDDYNAATDHYFVFDFIIPDPTSSPAQNESLLFYGLQYSNYVWLRRRTTGSLELIVRSGNAGKLDLYIPDEHQIHNKTMRMGLLMKSDGVFEVYLNGFQLATCTGKAAPLTNASTRLSYNKGISTEPDSSYCTRFRYFNTSKTRSECEEITALRIRQDLGLKYSRDANAIGLVGDGQSQMSGGEEVVNKSVMPEVATGRLRLLSSAGIYESFRESWYDPDSRTPINTAFAKEFSEYLAGYMGRAGNDIASQLSKTVVVGNAAQSGTKMSADWAGARTDLNAGTGTTTAVGIFNISLLLHLQIMNAVCGTVVRINDQGQGDALDDMTKADYKTQFGAQIDLIDYYYPDIPQYIVGFNKFDSRSTITEASWDGIQEARLETAREKANCTFIDLSDIEIQNTDGLHFLDDNQEIAGARIANVYTGASAEPLNFDNIISYVDANVSGRTVSSSEVSAVTARIGLNWAEVDPDDHMLEETFEFNGKGALTLRNTTQMVYTGFTASAVHTIMASLQVPTDNTGGALLFFANSGGGTDNQAKITFSNDNFIYSLNQASGNEVISPKFYGGEIVTAIFEFKSLTECVATWYDEYGVNLGSYTFDPNDDYDDWDSLLIGSITSGLEDGGFTGLKIGSWLHLSDTVTDAEKDGFANYVANRYDLTPINYFINSQTDITTGSPLSFDLADYPSFSEDAGALVIRYETPATAIDYTYLIVAHDGSSSNTIGIREDADEAPRGYTRESGASLHSAMTSQEVLRGQTSVAIMKYGNEGSTLYSGDSYNAQTHGALGNGINTVNIASRNADADPANLTVYEAVAIHGDKHIKDIQAMVLRDTDVIAVTGGQSLASGHFSSQENPGGNPSGGEEEFRNTVGALLGENVAIFLNGATGSSAASKTSVDDNYWWDLATDTAGTALTSFYNQVDVLGYSPNIVIWSQGEADSHQIDVTTTRQQYKDALLATFNDIRSSYPNALIVIQCIGRRTAFSNTGGVQTVREVQKELIEEYSWIHFGSEVYDRGLTDAVHLLDADYVVVANRNGRSVSNIKGYTITGSISGPYLSDVYLVDDKIYVKYNHDGGSDFTPTANIQGFVVHNSSDGSDITISSVAQETTDSIVITLSSAPSGNVDVYYAYDALLEITDLTKLVREDTTEALPLQSFTSLNNAPTTIGSVPEALLA